MKSLRNYFLGATLASMISLTGCNGFFKTDFIKENAKHIIETQQSLEEKYKNESGIDFLKHPKRKEVPVLTLNEDNTYTLFYTAEFLDVSDLETIVKDQMKTAVVSKSLSNNQLAINLQKESSVSYLEELLGNFDRLPSQVLIKLDVYDEFGNMAQDFASELDLTIMSQGEEFGAITGNSVLPGASSRLNARATMGTRWGGSIETDAFKFKAILDVLESHGYVHHVYETSLLLSNGQTGTLSEEEKLPIPSYVLSGRDTIQTYTLEPVKSFFEATPIISENGLVKLSFKAGIGSSKRPEARVGFQVPVKEEIEINDVYLKIGQPFLVAGKTNEMEIGVVRKDAILPWPASKDFEKIKSRIWYEITPYNVIVYDCNELERPGYEFKKLESSFGLDSKGIIKE